ncbi:MAG: hypothetical protein IT260_08580 [Saprospiraceae bacterium]|nr:hypothetical protein [Saprospiraceae bacterium]
MAHCTIHYLATKDKVVRVVEQYCSAQGIRLVPLSKDKQEEVEYLMLIEPVHIGYDDFALSTVWKPWLQEFYPNVKLIIASYAQSTHRCALNLLQLPKALEPWLDALPEVHQYPLQHGVDESNGKKYDVFYDPWTWFLPLSGRSLKEQMEKFLQGHENAQSFAFQTSRLRKCLIDIKDVMESGALENEQQNLTEWRKLARQEWDSLMVRWRNYQAFFAWMPFQETSKKIETLMTEIGDLIPIWTNTNADPAKIPHPDPKKIDALRRLVKDGLDRYIHEEDYW